MMPLSRRAAMSNVAREGAAWARVLDCRLDDRLLVLFDTRASPTARGRGRRRRSLPCVAGCPNLQRRRPPPAASPVASLSIILWSLSLAHYARHV